MQSRPDFDIVVVGKNLRRLRQEHNLKVREVREYLGFDSDQAVYKYETGKGYPQVETMFALMQLYDCTIEDLIYPYEPDASYGCNSYEGEDLESSPSFF